jgi:hypothetical protein
MHGRADDAGTVAGEHHRAVHLAQFAQTGGRELHVKRETAGADSCHDRVVTQHDERAGAAAEDAFEAVAQCRTRRHQREVRAQRVAAYAAAGEAGRCRTRRPRHRTVDADARRVGGGAWFGGIAVERHLYILRTVIQPNESPARL